MIIAIIFGVSFGWFMTNVVEWHRKFVPNKKPFNCCPCLSAWMGLVGWLVPDFYIIPMAIIFLCGTLAAILQKYTL